MSNRQIDNSFFHDKVALRINHLPDKKMIRVLDAYSGDGKIWEKIKRITKKNIEIIRIDQKADKTGIYLKGDNIKYLPALSLLAYDIIDLDAYGMPYKQLEILFNYRYSGIIFLTYIAHSLNLLPYDLLMKLGYTKKMMKIIPGRFRVNQFRNFKNYLSLYGVKSITYRSTERKHYVYFLLE